MYCVGEEDSETEMEHYLKKSEKIRATEEMRISSNLYSVFENKYTKFPANTSSPASFVTSGCCKYDEVAEARRRRLRSLDLKAVDSESFGREISTSAGVNICREATSSLEICGDSRKVMANKKAKLANIQKKPPVCAAKTPSAAELEEFFTEAEEYVQKRFSEKYNYDIVKDAPILGGRYEWVRTHI